MTRITGSDAAAEDIVHDAFERAMKYIDTYQTDQELSHWFTLILRNSFRDYLRAERGISSDELDEFDHEGARCDGVIRKIWGEIEDLINTHTDAQKDILTLHFLKDYSAVDISRFTEHSLSNVYQVINRFRIKVNKRYGGKLVE